jgi:alpha-ribazole phosphatase
MKKIIFIRHGSTKGNLAKRYIGKTDEGLCESGKTEIYNHLKEGIYEGVDLVAVSPMKRCLETAHIIFPNQPYILVEKCRECDFGDFENKNYSELKDSQDYQEWIDSNGTLPFPKGEDLEKFKVRCLEGFMEFIEVIEKKDEVESAALVVHGGTMMAIMSQLCNLKKSYYDWMIGNGSGYICQWNGESLEFIKTLK